MKSEKPTEMSEECSKRLERMTLRESRWKRVSRKRRCPIKMITPIRLGVVFRDNLSRDIIFLKFINLF